MEEQKNNLIPQFGSIPSPRDYRDIALSSVVVPTALPESFFVDISTLPIWNQMRNGSCCGHATAKYKQKLDLTDAGKLINLSPRFVYSVCKALDGWSGEGCFDEDTELLTKNGWKKHNEVDVGMEFATFSIDKEKIEFQKSTDIQKYDWDGEMIHVQNQLLDILVTPSHRCVVQNEKVYKAKHKKDLTPKYSIHRAEDLSSLSCSNFIPLVSDFSPNIVKSFSDEEVALIGWIITEGYYDMFQSRITITQNISKHYERIVSFLNKLNYSYRVQMKSGSKNPCADIRIGYKESQYIRNILPNKKLTFALISKLTKEQIGILFNEMILGDGTVDKKGSILFYQKDKETSDAFQYLAFLNGYSTYLRKHGQRENYIISCRKNKKAALASSEIKKIQYKGLVWCPSVPNTTVVARRNGLVFISGQTYPRLSLKVLKDYGCATEETVPNNSSLPHEEYVYNRDINKIPKEAFKEAELAKIESYASVDITPDGIKTAISQAQGCSMLVLVGNEWYTDKNGLNTWDKNRILPIKPPKVTISGHQIYAYGYETVGDDFKIHFINSWSENWADGGKGWFWWSEYKNFITEAWTAIDIPNELLEQAQNLPSEEEFKYNFKNVITYGQKSEDVRALQTALKILGFFKYPEITGYYGPITAKAVYDFQVKYNVASFWELYFLRGNRVGPKTRAMLNNLFNK